MWKSWRLAAAMSALAATVVGMAAAQTADSKLANLVPAGHKIVETVKGDLNKDGLEDYVLIIRENDSKKTDDGDDPEQMLKRNRKGIVIVFNKGDRYELALEKRGCFASHSMIDGIYYPIENTISIKKGNLYIEYSHGCRYGDWSYTFRYQNSDFELIGYDLTECVDAGRFVVNTSVNFQTKKMKTNKDVLEDIDAAVDDDGNKLPYEKWESIPLKESIQLRKIVNFDNFFMIPDAFRKNKNAKDYYK